jgi:hypothetical protein
VTSAISILNREVDMQKRMDRWHGGVYPVQENLIPRMEKLRRVPGQYRHILPLNLMKRHQCAVIGEEDGVLTVAITDRRDTSIFELLSRLTGYKIFPVLVDPERMRLLIRRMERVEDGRIPHALRHSSSKYDGWQLHSVLLFLTARSGLY